MELLFALISFAVLGLMAYGLFGFLAIGAAGASRSRAKASAHERLDAAFDGREVVTYGVTGIGGLQYDDVVPGAIQRGYLLVNDSGADSLGTRTLVFKKVQSSERFT